MSCHVPAFGSALLPLVTGSAPPHSIIRPRQVEGGPLQIGCRSDVSAAECMETAKKTCEVGGGTMTSYRPIPDATDPRYTHEFYCAEPKQEAGAKKNLSSGEAQVLAALGRAN
jgi:hypothetical protein